MAISGAGVNAVPSMRVHKESRIDGFGASRSGGLKPPFLWSAIANRRSLKAGLVARFGAFLRAK
jgi:hypothetical protein